MTVETNKEEKKRIIIEEAAADETLLNELVGIVNLLADFDLKQEKNKRGCLGNKYMEDKKSRSYH